MVKKIDVFLLAAGESSRMFPLSTIMEKSLLPVDGKPVIRHIVDNLTQPEVARHIRRIIICCLTKFKKQFEHEFRDMPSIIIEDMEKPLGTFSTFWAFTPYYEKPAEWAMVHYADCMTDINYLDFISKIDSNPNTDGIIAVTNQVKHDYSEVSVTKSDNTVQDFVEKPYVMNYCWSGIGLFRTVNIEKFYNPPNSQDFAFDIFPKMIEKGTLKAYPYNGSWVDVGNLNSYRKICALYDGTNGNVKL